MPTALQKVSGHVIKTKEDEYQLMHAKQLTPEISVAGQISASDVAEAAAQGFKSIVCNRPDGEGLRQPPFTDIARAADDAGISIRYLPVVSGRISEKDVARFGRALDELPSPVLAYCCVGLRSATLWALSQRGKLPLDEIAATLRVAGL
jgi:sulfide:quinone oxidoreductase